MAKLKGTTKTGDFTEIAQQYKTRLEETQKRAYELREVATIKTAEPFKSIFPERPSLIETISESMQAEGYDMSQPVHIWQENDVLVDGHNRLAAALKAGLSEIPVFVHSFESEDDAVDYAVHLQRDRRNLAEDELYRYIQQVDSRKKTGRKLASDEAKYGKSAEETAEKAGVSRAKVERARFVDKHADEATKDAVSSGKTTINAAYNATRESRKAEKTPPAASGGPQNEAKDDSMLSDDIDTFVTPTERPFMDLRGNKLYRRHADGTEVHIITFEDGINEREKMAVLSALQTV